MAGAAKSDPIKFFEDERNYGYAKVEIKGHYTGAATPKDVERQFYHPVFGGRGAWAYDGRFGCTVHTD